MTASAVAKARKAAIAERQKVAASVVAKARKAATAERQKVAASVENAEVKNPPTRLDRQQLNRQMAQLADGDRLAFDAVYRSLRPIVFRFCTRMLGGSGDVEDVVQESLLKLFRQASNFDRSRDATTWALAIAAWQCKSARRDRSRQRQRTRTLDSEPKSVGHNEVELQLQAREALRLLEPLIGQLKEGERNALLQSLSETGLLDATARKRKQRAITQLKRWWSMLNGRA